jgi:hypothetical protein
MSLTATKSDKLIYWIATGLMLFLMLWAVVTYPIFWDSIGESFEEMGFPSYIPKPLWALKLIGVIVIITNKYDNLKNWVYATYFFNMLFSIGAHLTTDGFIWHALVGLIVIPVSYIYSNRVRGRPQKNLFILPERAV